MSEMPDPTFLIDVLKLGGAASAAGIACYGWWRSERRCDFLIARLKEVQEARIKETREDTIVIKDHTAATNALAELIKERIRGSDLMLKDLKEFLRVELGGHSGHSRGPK